MNVIKNAKIVSADLSMADHGILTLQLQLEGDGWGCIFGNRVIGKGYIGAKEFKGYDKGIEEIMRIMDVVGVEHFSDLTNKYVRVVTEPCAWGKTIDRIGNIIQDKWFDYTEFYGDGTNE